MALRFPYRQITLQNPGITVGGARYRYRPIVDLSVTAGQVTVARETLLDPGADELVAPEAVAMVLGLDLTSAPIGTSSGVGGMVFPVRFAQVELRLSDGLEFRTWPAVMGFTTAPMRRILLGIAHGLEFFTATFHGDRHEVELEVNASYPGS